MITCTLALRVPETHMTLKLEIVPGQAGDTLRDLAMYWALDQDLDDDDWEVAGWLGADVAAGTAPHLILSSQMVRRANPQGSHVHRADRPRHRTRVAGPVGEVIDLVAAARVQPGTVVLVTDDPSAASVRVGAGPWPTRDPGRARQATVKRTVRTERNGAIVGVDVETSLGTMVGLPPMTGLRPAA